MESSDKIGIWAVLNSNADRSSENSSTDIHLPWTAAGAGDLALSGAVNTGVGFAQARRIGTDFHPTFPGAGATKDRPFIPAGLTFFLFRH
jgi:hypothetical protein